MTRFAGIGKRRIGLTVCDLDPSKVFFEGALGWTQFGGNPDYPSAYMTDGYARLTLWERKAQDFNRFDRHKNVALHHLALKVQSSGVLQQVFAKVREWPGRGNRICARGLGQGAERTFHGL